MFNFNFIKKNQGEEIDAKTEEYEEISEKKTSKLGYILLIILMVFLVIIGQKIFSDIKDIPERPVHPAHCIFIYSDINFLRNCLFVDRTCRFTEIDKKFDVEKNFKDIEPQINSIIYLNLEISGIKNQINSNERALNKLLGKYDVSLQEKMAEEIPILDRPQIKTSTHAIDQKIASLNRELLYKTQERDEEIKIIEPKLIILKTAYEQAIEYYENKIAFYNFTVFLLRLLFVLPLFILSLYFYFKLKKKDSPHTIIVAAIAVASSILFIQIVLMFLYEVLPIEWLLRVFKLLMEITILKYVIYYGSVLGVIAVFGSIVYFIQKKVFNPKIVAVRRLKDNKCPNCSFSLNQSYDFCPKCGRKLKEKCVNCGNLKIKDLSFCPFCGKKSDN